MREAGRDDIETLIGFMRDFYAESGFDLVQPRAAAAFEALIGRPDLGRIWLMEQEGQAAGYIVVTFVFTMEHGGVAGVIDDFYVRPESRGEGLGTAALAAVRRVCLDLGLRAMRVEVGADNEVARAVYRGAGFEPLPGHGLMQAALAPPSHAT